MSHVHSRPSPFNSPDSLRATPTVVETSAPHSPPHRGQSQSVSGAALEKKKHVDSGALIVNSGKLPSKMFANLNQQHEAVKIKRKSFFFFVATKVESNDCESIPP